MSVGKYFSAGRERNFVSSLKEFKNLMCCRLAARSFVNLDLTNKVVAF